MLKLVGQVLEQLGLLPPGGRLRYSINITAGESLAISAFVSPRRFFQVKASEFMDLREQYRAHCRGWEHFPGFVPRPLGQRTIAGWSLMVTEGVEHVPAHAGGRTLKEDALAFFAAGARAAPRHAGHDALLETLERHFAATPLQPVALQCLRHARILGAQRLHALAQHGDLVVNNLAYAGSRFIVFDWEDFDRVPLPGLDLCTLLLSLLQEDAAAMRAVMAGASTDASLDDFIARACITHGLPDRLFRQLIPLYLLAFLYLKRNYGQAIQQRIGALLPRLAEGLPRCPQHEAMRVPQ